MITYPPDNHETDSKSIFFIGSARESCTINGDEVKLHENGNFSHTVKLKLGENKFDIELDGAKEQRKVIGIKSKETKPVAYGEHYDSFPPEQANKQNILRSIIVENHRIRIPLNIAPIYNLEKWGSYKYVLDLADIEMDLDWIHYKETECPIIIGEVINSKFPIIFKKAVKNIEEKWEDDYLVLEITYNETDFKVCLDPGHGGHRHGTCSPKGLFEKDLNLSFALKLKEELDNLSVNTVITRDDDRYISLEDRVDFSNEEKSQLFLSIHHNALPDSGKPEESRGASCHYYHEQSKPFANFLLNSLVGYAELPYAGLLRQNLHVLREATDCVAVLVELGYLIHPEEADIISSDEFQTKTAEIMAKAIHNFFCKS